MWMRVLIKKTTNKLFLRKPQIMILTAFTYILLLFRSLFFYWGASTWSHNSVNSIKWSFVMLLNIFHQKNKTKELKKANRAFKLRSLAILCRISALFYHFLASVAPRNYHTLIWSVSDEWFWSSTLMIRPKCDKNWSYMLCFSYLVCLPIFKVVLGP